MVGPQDRLSAAGRRFVRRVHWRPFGAGICVTTLAAACQSAPGAGGMQATGHSGCVAQVIVAPVGDWGSPPDQRFVTDLARASDVHLTFLRLAGPNLYVFSLVSEHSDPDCDAALNRLRERRELRFAEMDQRRRAHD